MILSHRGYWLNEEEKNTIGAFERSFSLGFGTETDIRDHNGQLVISHDMADSDCISLEKFFQIFISYDKALPLALNIKADGLQNELLFLIQKYQIENYFVFDMSVPDLLHYKIKGIPYLIRQSEYEQDLSLITESAGVWLDEFHEEWITRDYVEKIVELGKTCYVVSAELHQKEYMKSWEKWRYIFEDVSWCLCTDFPLEARKFFFEKG